MPPPLREQLASGAAIPELQGAGARGVSCQQPEQRPRAATFPARSERRSAQAGTHTGGVCTKAQNPPSPDKRQSQITCWLHFALALVLGFYQ